MFERTNWSRMGHLLFVAAILAYSTWYAFDAIGSVENIESAMAVVVCAVLVVVLGVLILAREGLRTFGDAPVSRRPTDPGVADTDGADTDGADTDGAYTDGGDARTAAPLASPALLGAVTILYLFLIGIIGIEISTFVYLACLARLLGVRSLLANLFYSAAIAAVLIWMVHFFADPPEPLIRIFGAGA